MHFKLFDTMLFAKVIMANTILSNISLLEITLDGEIVLTISETLDKITVP